MRFKIEPFATPGGAQTREVALLDEQQATLLLTYMRNSGIVRAFKKRLVREFYAMRQGGAPAPAFTIPTTHFETLRLAADRVQQIEQRQRLSAPSDGDLLCRRRRRTGLP